MLRRVTELFSYDSRYNQLKFDRTASIYAELASANAVLREENSSCFETINLLLEKKRNLSAGLLAEAADRTSRMQELLNQATLCDQARREQLLALNGLLAAIHVEWILWNCPPNDSGK